MTNLWQFSISNIHLIGWIAPLMLIMYVCIYKINLKLLIILSLITTLFLISLGAYVRLTDAGLGCPDWPGCYGKLTPFHAKDSIDLAVETDPNGPVNNEKAWNEMVHRYIGSLVGVFILSILFKTISLRRSRILSISRNRLVITFLLTLLVLFQGLLGKWTVTYELKPIIVTLHLIGGMLILGSLAYLLGFFYYSSSGNVFKPPSLVKVFFGLSIFLVLLQIALGGWVSTNYASLACVGFPKCNGFFVPDMNFAEGFNLMRNLSDESALYNSSNSAIISIHFVHRIGAYILAFYLIGMIIVGLKIPYLRDLSLILSVVLLSQIVLGIMNVTLLLPLWSAVMHNFFSALLLINIIFMNLKLNRNLGI